MLGGSPVSPKSPGPGTNGKSPELGLSIGGSAGGVSSARGPEADKKALGAAGSAAVAGNGSAKVANGDADKSPGKAPEKAATTAAKDEAPAKVEAPAKAEAAKEEGSPKAPKKDEEKAAATTSDASGPIEPEAVLKFHSAVRWAKPWAEIQDSADGVSLKAISSEKDPKNGNTVMHIAAQNGHMEIIEKLIEAGAPLNVHNGKGQTPLHMSVEYDFYFVSRLLIDNKADGELKNEDGHKALHGIDGGKIDLETWDNPVTILRAANTAPELAIAFDSLEKALADSPEIVSKEKLISCGLQKKKSPITQAVWDHKKFMTIAAKF
jgi:hypothetical protein